MASSNGKDNAASNVEDFPPVTELAQFHVVLGDLRESIGTDHANVPVAMLCIILRDDAVEEYVLQPPEATLAMVGAMEFVKAGILEGMFLEEE